MSRRRESWHWRRLQGLVTPALLAAPLVDWAQMDWRIVRYLVRTVAGTSWLDPLALMAGVLVCYARLDVATVLKHLRNLHCRFQTILPACGLATFQHWRPEEHVTRYLRDPDLNDTEATRQEFLKRYVSASVHLHRYLRALPPAERSVYQPFALAPLPPELHRQLSRRTELAEAQQRRRKAETDAVTPFFSQIRGEAHLRWNSLYRLQSQFRQSLAQVAASQERLPAAFSYEERPGLRLYFRIWDQPSFVLAHASQYSVSTVRKAQAGKERFRPEENHRFVEFVRVESNGIEAGETWPWFADLLRHGLLGNAPRHGTEAEVRRKQTYLRSWGYGETTRDRLVGPFATRVTGLLTWPKALAQFVAGAQERVAGLLIPVESLFAAATFGLAALDLLTTTGARLNEVLQVSLTPDCLHTLVVEGTQRLVLRLLPKGGDQLADYFVGSETRRNLEKVARLLQEHYGLTPGEAIPAVPFHPEHERAHRFPPRPYLFQYNRSHLRDDAITACLRFLCHGITFQTLDGRAVVLKAHLLRHVFATHAHHVEKVPLDVVGAMLHQKDPGVTGYYAAPTRRQVVAAADALLDRFATHLGDVGVLVRGPEELRRQFDVARQHVGTLARVVGGHCTSHAICPVSFACTGCAHKVPDPDRRQEVVQQKEWALVRLEQVETSRLGPEAAKMRALIQRCDAELEEMRLMEAYRKDEQYEPELRFEPRA